MFDLRESVVFAALGVIIVSIPAASQNVEIQEDQYSGMIDSKFSELFKVDFMEGKVFTKALSSDSKLVINKSFRKKVIEFQTSEGSIRKIWTNNSIVKKVQTPHGSFESGVRDGENFSEYDGSSRGRAESLKDKLEQRLKEKLSRAEEKRKIVVQKILPNVEMSVQSSHDIEHFNLTNQGDETVKLEDWRVLSEGSSRDSMQLSGKLEPGEKLSFTGSAGEVDFEARETDMTIYSGEATLTLFNSEERIVDSVEH